MSYKLRLLFSFWCAGFVMSGILLHAQNPTLDSLNQRLATTNSNKHFPILLEIFKEQISLNYDSALFYAEKLVNRALADGDSLSIVISLNARGNVKRELGISSCIPDFEFALEIAQRMRFTNQTKFLLNNLALAHGKFAQYDEALDYNFQSLQLRQEIGNKQDISIALNNIGVVYSNLQDYENALSYFIQCKDMKEANGITHDLDRAYVNIGVTYFQMENYVAADSAIATVFKLCIQQGCKEDVMAEARYALAKILIKKEEYEPARKELDEIIAFSRRNASKFYEAQSQYLKAMISWKQNDPESALRFLDMSDMVLTGTELRDQMLENYLLYTSIYEGIGDFRKAAAYQQKYIDLNKQVFSGDLIKNISRIQTEFEERENLKTIASKNRILALQAEVIARQKTQYAFIVAITFLVTGIVMVLFRSNQLQRKANKELADAKATIENQNELLNNANQALESEVLARTIELVDSNESLVKANEELDNFIYKTSHDIRGPLASLKGICNIAMIDVHDETAIDYLKKLDTTAAKLNSILSRLLIINQINHSLLNPQYLKIEELIEEVLDLERKKGIPARIDISYTVASDLSFRSDREIVKIILENLIDNAIKFYNDSLRIQPFVRISVMGDNRSIIVKVLDNGIGIDESSKEKIFQLFVRASERSDSGGIGLYLSKLASAKLGGQIQFSTTAENFTEFTVKFPADLVPIIEDRRTEELNKEKQKQKVLKST